MCPHPHRLWDLEKQIKQLRNYRDNYQGFCKWLYDAKRRQDALESMKFSDSNTVMRYLNEQKVECACPTHPACPALAGQLLHLARADQPARESHSLLGVGLNVAEPFLGRCQWEQRQGALACGTCFP